MKNYKKVFLILTIILIIIGVYHHNVTKFNKEELSSNWKKDAKEVLRVYFNALNSKDYDLLNECIYPEFGIEHIKKYRKNLVYIKYLDASEYEFKPEILKLDTGKDVPFEDGKVYEVMYKIRNIIENQPEVSGKNCNRYTLIKDENGDYKIINSGY